MFSKNQNKSWKFLVYNTNLVKQIMGVPLKFYPILILCILVMQLCASDLNAQIFGTENKEGDNAPAIEDSYGRSTPRGTVNGFLSAISEQNYELATLYLKLPENTNEVESLELAKNFQRILDMGDLTAFSRISNDSTGRINDDLEPNLDKVGKLETANDSFEIFVERIFDEQGKAVWLFSESTMEKVASINLTDDGLLINKILPESLKKTSWGGIPLGHLLFTLVLIILSYLAAWLISFLLFLIINYIWKKTTKEPTLGLIKTFTLPLRLYLAVWIFVHSLQRFGISIILKEKLQFLVLIVGIVSILMFLWRLNKFIGRYTNKKMLEQGNVSSLSVVQFLQRFFKIVILIVGFIIILYIMGVDVTAGLAALGIGGIALALGAQKTMENFVGSVTLIADQPIRVGDFCKVGEIKGTVERIGMRSTKIRTSARTVITIPNGQFSSESIENYAPRDKFLFLKTIELRAESSPDQIRYLLVKLRELLYAHPKTSMDPARVRFIEFGPSSINIELYTYLMVANLDESLEVKEDLLLRIMDIVKESGTDFAYPSQTLYLTKDSGLSAEKSQMAESTVFEWKEKNKLAVPHFSPEHIEKIKDSIKYPPLGSETNETSQSQTKLDMDE